MTPDEILERVLQDARYQSQIDWGAPRPGHPEGTIRAHIAQLETNLAALAPRLTEEESAVLRLLIHVHDTFKPQAAPGVPIAHPHSHASLARSFLAEFCDEPDWLAMVQWHDEPYALWQQQRSRGAASAQRLAALLAAIEDWRLFAAFVLLDSVTPGKDRRPLMWFLQTFEERAEIPWTAADVAFVGRTWRSQPVLEGGAS